MRRLLVRIAVAVVVLTLTAGAVAVGQTQDRRVRELILLTRPQAVDPQEFEMARLLAPEFEKLGFRGQVGWRPWGQLRTIPWLERTMGDMPSGRRWGGAERADPEGFYFNLFHPSR